MKKPLIIIEVEQGMVKAVHSTNAVNYVVIDHDIDDPFLDHPVFDGPLEPNIYNKNIVPELPQNLQPLIQKVVDEINDKDYPNKRTFFVKDESGRDFSGNFTTAQLLTLRDPDEEDMNGERLFEYAEEAQPGDEWHAWGVKITCIE